MCREPINNRTLAQERERMGIPHPSEQDAAQPPPAAAAVEAQV